MFVITHLSPHCFHTMKTLGWVHIIFDQDSLGGSCAATSSLFSLTRVMICYRIVCVCVCIHYFWVRRIPWKRVGYPLQYYYWASLVTQMVKNMSAMWEIWVWSLGWEDPLEEGMATHSSILAGESSWIEESGKLQSTILIISPLWCLDKVIQCLHFALKIKPTSHTFQPCPLFKSYSTHSSCLTTPNILAILPFIEESQSSLSHRFLLHLGYTKDGTFLSSCFIIYFLTEEACGH